VRNFEASRVAPEKMGMDLETGFVLHRFVMLAVMASMLVIVGAYALRVTVVLAQAFGAGTEIMRDRYVGMPTQSPRPAPIPPRPTPVSRRRGRRRR
jgi:hypothetical protein